MAELMQGLAQRVWHYENVDSCFGDSEQPLDLLLTRISFPQELVQLAFFFVILRRFVCFDGQKSTFFLCLAYFPSLFVV